MLKRVYAVYFIIFVFTNFSLRSCDGKKYNNYTLYRAIPVNSSHFDFISNLDELYDINYWRRPGQLYRSVDFVINPKDQVSFLKDAETHGVYLTTIIKDVQTAFDRQTVKSYIRRQMDSFDWNNYFRLDDIYQWLRDLSKKFPEEIKLRSIGKSHENRDIISVEVRLKGGPKEKNKIIVEGGIHAREWIASAFVTYLINEVVHAQNSTNKLLKKVAAAYEWHFVPVLNVDGYEYTHTDDRLWRKNRNGYGVDLNRNFGHAFGSRGVSWIKSSEVYCGQNAFSEKESKAMSKYIRSHSKNLEYYISFHAYGQYIILPYSNSKKHLANFDAVNKICKRIAQKILARYQTKYVTGTSYDTVGYLSSGVSGCWVKSEFNVPFVVTFELRDNGYDGFALPPSQILPTCKETMDGILELLTTEKKQLMLKSSDADPVFKKSIQMITAMFCAYTVVFVIHNIIYN